MKPTLTDQDFTDAAAELVCEVAAIRAVCQVEAPKGGFNPDDSPATLFEGHKFYKYTAGRFAVQAPDLCFKVLTRAHYGKTWQQEQARLQRAMELDREAALKSASWGKFQIMGFNHAMVGFASVQAFVNAMYVGEREQLLAFVRYVQTAGLAPALRRRDWAAFAHGYNGPAYADNDYDGKMAKAFAGFEVLA
ncbi:N-acetylmuramidase family protein [Rhodoferax ferrireducens]|uniref:N-acetylmuramidase family protein n=1 Tax=Rhodoferax ferrireducens TaxID=192843 RepID=UPI000E0D9E3F|nr:N-acetylmuramidase family protein [Rhodoferax ferrireducens]